MNEDSEADRRRQDSVYEREGMVPERLLHDLATTPVVDESELPDERAHKHEGELTEAERQIVTYLSHGWTLKMIGEQRGVSEHTIRSQVKSASTALGAKHRAHLVALAFRAGLIE